MLWLTMFLEKLLRIMKFRNDEVARSMMEAIQDNGRALTGLMTLSNQNADAISKLTLKAQRDSWSTKVLTVVASLYLPATLVASIFNSNLVQSAGPLANAKSTPDGHLIAAHDFWMFPAFTAALMVLTLSPVGLYMFLRTRNRTRNGTAEC